MKPVCCGAPTAAEPPRRNSRPMLYRAHEYGRLMLRPWVCFAEAASRMFGARESVLAALAGAARVSAAYELMHRLGKEYEKPSFGITRAEAHGHEVPVIERVALDKPFCRLLRFKRFSDDAGALEAMRGDPPVLIVAPMSGHHSTLLRDTVQTMLRDHKVWVTDWNDARMVPESAGAFHLDDYVDYIQEFIRHIG